ncbi:REP-associated tyrosine transposase [Pseudomonas alkylphenolica]|uniref:REP-associated tyrosine transposase n=1 Tax=Pseudomonas alkylphenolica TaxID=237609 RepID=UPI0018D6E7E7|nr:transposase [Pseudomonas alkylphenolica]MBH3426590.1 transposase [Pseudomonas alkylphenolica]
MDRPASHRLRQGRVSIPGQVYLLTTTVEHRKPVFADFHLARMVVEQLRQTQDCNLAKSLAWVVMPDHIHWLVELQHVTLDALMRRMKCRSTGLINKSSNRHGRLWQKGFHDRALRREDDILAVARYIVANPLRAGLVSRVGDYPHWDACWL